MKYSEWSSVVEYLTNNLAKEIEDGDYAPGARFLTEKEICARYEVGRSSAREALRILEATGVVEIKRGRGAFVAASRIDTSLQAAEWYSANAPALQEVIDARLMLEPAVAEKLAEVISESHLTELEEICRRLDEAYAAHNLLNVVALDEEFHVALVDGIGNQLLTEFNQKLQERSSFYRAKTYAVPQFFTLAQTEHRGILTKLRERDGAAAGALMRTHIASARGYFAELADGVVEGLTMSAAPGQAPGVDTVPGA